MAAGLAEARGAGTGVILAARQAQVSAASIVVPTTVSPCSSSQRQKQPHIKQRVKKGEKTLVEVSRRHGYNFSAQKLIENKETYKLKTNSIFRAQF